MLIKIFYILTKSNSIESYTQSKLIQNLVYTNLSGKSKKFIFGDIKG